ncbi:Uncharacterised protein [Mycobacterium tuberculosis]|nr:Uncharacterised protein [Mycobacterium tuberculosis]
MRLRPDRHRLFLHRFKQRALCLRRRPVDLIGQDEIAKNRTRLEPVGRFPFQTKLDYVRSGNVGRHQIGRKLNAREAHIKRIGHRTNQHRFAEPRYPFEQRVTPCKNTPQQLLHDILLPDNHPADLFLDRSNHRSPRFDLLSRFYHERFLLVPI